MIKKAEIGIRRNQFISQLNMVESTKRKYREALGSVFLNNIIRNEFNKESIYEFSNLEELWKLYSMVNLHPDNVRMHRYYSAPIMKYIAFLNGGKKYGKRIDYMKKRVKKTKEGCPDNNQTK